MFQLSFCITSATKAYLSIPSCSGPKSPVSSISRPTPVQLSHQNIVDCPLFSSTRISEAARDLILRSFRHIHDPTLLSRVLQKEALGKRLRRHHATPDCVKSLQIRLSAKTRDESRILLIPNPPSSLGLHTSSQATFVFV